MNSIFPDCPHRVMEMPPLELPLTDLEFVEVKEEHANTEEVQEEFNPQEDNSHSIEPDPVLWPSSDSQEKPQNEGTFQ